jgi:glycosyltransferase involved in cell wall biosynthesis
MLNNNNVLRLVGRFAKWVYKHANEICVISPGFKKNLIEKGVSAKKIHVISNWVDTKTHYPKEPEAGFAEKLGLAGRFNIMFAGNIGEAQGLEAALGAAELLKDLKELQLVFVGDGVSFPRLKQEVERKQLTNVLFLGRYPEHSMPNLYALANVLLIHVKDNPLFRITIPHKIFTYMASGKPILAAINGDAADVITETGAGLTCAPQDIQAIAATALKFFYMNECERRQMGECGLVAAQTLYNRDTLVGKIENVLLSAANGRD